MPSSATTSDSPSSLQPNSATSETSSTIATIAAVPSQKLISTNSPIPVAVGMAGGITLVIGVVVAVLICTPGAHLSDYWPTNRSRP
jgi:hypothetical protein